MLHHRVLAVAETGQGHAPAAVSLYHCQDPVLGLRGPYRKDRYTIRRDTVRTLAWGPDTAATVVGAVGLMVVILAWGGSRLCSCLSNLPLCSWLYVVAAACC